MADTTMTPQRRQAAPSLEDVDSFYELLGRGLSATAQGRFLRAAEFNGRVAAEGRALWRDMGALCVVTVHLRQYASLIDHAQATAAVDDAAPLWLEAQSLLAECRRILSAARLSANTCLVGRCFAVEEDFFARYYKMFLEATRGEALTAEEEAYKEFFTNVKRGVGYKACMDAAHQSLRFAYPALSFPGAQPGAPLKDEVRKEVQAFALRCVGIMGTPHLSPGFERQFAVYLRDLLASNDLEQPFKVQLAQALDRPALRRALRAWCVTDEEDAAIGEKVNETFNTMAAADLAKHGLRWCALPSCAKQELHVFDFKACSACKAVVYCSAEHGALHWTRGHRKECAALRAAGAKPRSTADAGEGGVVGGVSDIN